MSGKDGNDFLSCAFRETKEEYFALGISDTLIKIMILKPNQRSRIIIPFIFEFHTYLIDVTDIQPDFSHNYEFSEISWFETRQLPEKTHIGVRYSLWAFGLK